MDYLSRRHVRRNSRQDREAFKAVVEDGLDYFYEEPGVLMEFWMDVTAERSEAMERMSEFQELAAKCAEENVDDVILILSDYAVSLYPDYPQISSDPRVQVRYIKMRKAGESHSMAEMLATRSFPGVRTDSTFNEGRCNGNQFESHPGLGNHYQGIAAAAGVSTTGKTYLSSLADFPGDPKAWVSGRGDILRVCEERGYKCSGAVEYQPDSWAHEPQSDVTIGDDIIQNEVDDIMDMGEAEGLRRSDVEEKVRELRSGAVDPNPLCLGDSPDDGSAV